MGAAIDHVGLAPVPPLALGQQAVDRREQQGGTVEHGHVDHLTGTGRPRLENAAQEAHSQEHAASTEVADQVERGHGRIGGTDGVKGAG